MFEIEVAGRAARIQNLFPGFSEHDRIGLVMRRPCGALGASALLTAAITAFYDIQRARAQRFFIYPDYFLFHVGGPLGEHGRLDIWPRREEVVVEDDPERILEAVSDRAITRLLVEDGPRGDVTLPDEPVASARARIRSCLAYSASGRVDGSDVRIAGNPVAEGYVETVLERSEEIDPAVRRAIRLGRRALVEGGVPVESYRRIDLDEALALLG